MMDIIIVIIIHDYTFLISSSKVFKLYLNAVFVLIMFLSELLDSHPNSQRARYSLAKV